MSDESKVLRERIECLERSRPLACYDCGRRYDRGPDLIVPDHVWLRIAPHEDGGGVLCPNCMHDRCAALGLSDVPALFKSGPFACDSAESRAIRAEQERDEARRRVEDLELEIASAERQLHRTGANRGTISARAETAADTYDISIGERVELEEERDSLRARLAKADPLTTSTVAQQEERPDKNCITLPNGDCVGRNCMHDAPAPTAAPHADCVARALEICAEVAEENGSTEEYVNGLRERAAELQKGDGGR